MELKNLVIKTDKNNTQYLQVTYVSKNNKDVKINLTHFDIEYCVKGKIKYEISKNIK